MRRVSSADIKLYCVSCTCSPPIRVLHQGLLAFSRRVLALPRWVLAHLSVAPASLNILTQNTAIDDLTCPTTSCVRGNTKYLALQWFVIPRVLMHHEPQRATLFCMYIIRKYTREIYGKVLASSRNQVRRMTPNTVTFVEPYHMPLFLTWRCCFVRLGVVYVQPRIFFCSKLI